MWGGRFGIGGRGGGQGPVRQGVDIAGTVAEGARRLDDGRGTGDGRDEGGDFSSSLGVPFDKGFATETRLSEVMAVA
jgi:hypothetical protein